MSEESFTITDNRSGESVTVPIVDGTISSAALRELDKGMWFYDPAYMSTANCNSKITYIDGGNGILRYRGYPIEQLAEHSNFLEVCYLLLNGELPTEAEADAHIRSRRYSPIHEGLAVRRSPNGDTCFYRCGAVYLLPRGEKHKRSS